MPISKFLISLSFIVWGSAAWAQIDIRGFVQKRGGDLFLVTQEYPSFFHLKSANNVVSEGLSKLNRGDYVHGTGEVNRNEKTITLHSLDFVGLQEILGAWITEDHQVFDFLDFERLFYYGEMSPTQTEEGRPEFSELHYTLAPSRLPGRWRLLLLGDKSAQVGYLRHEDDDLCIEFIDPHSGQIMDVLELKPYHLDNLPALD